MPDHSSILSAHDPSAVTQVALNALKKAATQQTSNAGSVFIPDGQVDNDDGNTQTGIIIGEEAAELNGIGKRLPDGTIVPIVEPVDLTEVNEAIDSLNTVALPALQADVTQAKTDSSTVKDDLATLNTVTLPGITQTVTQVSEEASTAQATATSAQTAANLALANSQELLEDPTFTQKWDKWVNRNAANASVYFDTDNGDLTLDPNANVAWYTILVATPNLSGTTPVGHDRTYRISCDVRAPGDGTDTVFYVSVATGMNLLIPTSELSQTDYTHFEKDTTLKANAVLRTSTLIALWTPGDAGIAFKNIHVRDITEAQAAQKAADSAQATADTAQVAADNAKALANTAQAAAQGAQTTADGKNKIFSSVTQPSSTGLVPGDLWFQLDSSSHVTGIQVWNGSAFVDYLIVANQILVAGSVGTTQIKNGAITTDALAANSVSSNKIVANAITGDKIAANSVTADKITAGAVSTSELAAGSVTADKLTANSVTAEKIAAESITSDKIAANSVETVNLAANAITAGKIAAGSIDGMTITGSTLRTTNGHIVINDTGISATDNSGVTTVNIPADGGTPMLTGGFQTRSDGSRIKVSEENGVGRLQLLENTSEVGSLRIFHNENGYAYVQLGAGVDGIQIASSTNEPDPLKPTVMITSTYSTRIAGGGGVNIGGTWFADDLSLLPTSPRQVGSVGTIGFAGGVRYVYDGKGSWQEYDTRVVSTNLTDFFTPASGFTQYNNESQVYRSGGLWHLHIAVDGPIPSNTYTIIGTVKPEYRPLKAQRGIACMTSGWTGGAWMDPVGVNNGSLQAGNVHVGNKSGSNGIHWATLDFVYPDTQFNQ